jgi:hypothetical protein
MRQLLQDTRPCGSASDGHADSESHQCSGSDCARCLPPAAPSCMAGPGGRFHCLSSLGALQDSAVQARGTQWATKAAAAADATSLLIFCRKRAGGPPRMSRSHVPFSVFIVFVKRLSIAISAEGLQQNTLASITGRVRQQQQYASGWRWPTANRRQHLTRLAWREQVHRQQPAASPNTRGHALAQVGNGSVKPQVGWTFTGEVPGTHQFQV